VTIGHVIAGAIVGLLLGISGVGGGAILTPLLISVFGVDLKVAVGTDLLFASITKVGGSFVHHNANKSVDWKIVGLLCAGSLPASLITLYFMDQLGRMGKELTHAILLTLGASLLLTAGAMILRAFLQTKRVSGEGAEGLEAPSAPQAFATILMGFVLGALVTFTSVGAGAIGTVALMLIYPKLPAVKIVGTDLSYAIPLTAVAGLGHLKMGHVDFHLLIGLLAGSLPGIWAGSLLSGRIPSGFLRIVLAVLLLLTGLKYLL
jgi:uncharacterized membrane protein YfcA